MFHTQILQFLQSSLKRNKASHTYLFTGPKGVGKKETAYLVFNWLLNNPKEKISSSLSHYQDAPSLLKHHPDFLRIAHPKEIKINQIRQIKNFLSATPFQAQYKSVLLQDAEKMNREAQNAFLKTLEEPHKNSIIILTSSAPDYLLKTILSRCKIIKIPLSSSQKCRDLLSCILRKEKALKRQAPKESILNYIGGRLGEGLALWKESDIITKKIETINSLLSLQNQFLYQKFALLKKLIQKKDEKQCKLLLKSWILYFRDCLLAYYNMEQKIILLPLLKKKIDKEQVIPPSYNPKPSLAYSSALKITKIVQNIELLLQALEKIKLNLNKEMVMEEVCLKIQTAQLT